MRTLKEYDLKPIEFEIKPPSKLQGKYKGFEFDTDCDYSERGYATFLILKCPKEKVLEFDHKSHWLAGYDFDFLMKIYMTTKQSSTFISMQVVAVVIFFRKIPYSLFGSKN